MGKRRGFGYLRKLKSGRWQASYIGPDQQRHTAPGTFQTKQDGELWLAARQGEVKAGVWVQPAPEAAPRTFKEFAEANLRQRKLTDKTRSEYQRMLDRDLLPVFGHRTMASIGFEDIDDWYAGLNPKTKTMNARIYGFLSSFFHAAVKRREIAYNPCVIKGASNVRRNREPVPATLEELAVMTDKTPEQYRLMVQLAAWCAMRSGELTELRRKDVDLKALKVRIHRAVTWVDGKPVIGDPKNESKRTVAVPPHLKPMMEAHLKTVPAGRDQLLFPARRNPNEHMTPSMKATWYSRAKKAADRPDLTFHDLRHTGATFAAATGATLKELMDRLGHSTTAAAMRYQHAAADRDSEIARLLSKLVE